MRPFRLYTRSELETVVVAFEAVLQRWAKEWFPLAKPSAVSAKDFGAELHPQQPEDNWTAYATGKSNRVLLGKRPEFLKAVANAIAGEAAKHELIRLPLSPILADVVERALSDLAAQLAAAKGETPQIQTDASDSWATVNTFGSGALLCEFRLADCAVSIVCNASVAQYYVAVVAGSNQPKKKLAPRTEAIAARTVHTQLVLGHSELAVAELVSLAAGDVILLDRRVGQPFDLCAKDGQVLSSVEIGTRGPHIAAAIVRNS